MSGATPDVTTHIAEVLLSEVMGFRTQVETNSDVAGIFARAHAGAIDFNLEVWTK